MGKIKGWKKIGIRSWENQDLKQRIFVEWSYKTSSHDLFNVKLYKEGSITILRNVARQKEALKEAMQYMRSHQGKTTLVGTGKFTYNENCKICKERSMVDINGHCKDCVISDKEMYAEIKHEEARELDIDDRMYEESR